MTATAPTQRCRVCNTEAPAGAIRCPNCSAAMGELAPCPHCRGSGGVSVDAEFKYKCDICGGPRVPRGPDFKSSGKENTHLRAADAARKARAGYRAGAIAAGLGIPIFSAFFLLLALIFGIGLTLVLASLVVVAPVVAFSLFAAGRARARGAHIAPQIDAAWVSVANDVANQATGTLTAADLVAKLGIEEGQAEELVALLDVNAIVAPTRSPLRIDAGAPPSPAGRDALAEEEAALVEAEGHAAAAKAQELKR